MPERDYSKGQIYTIRCRDDPALIYVGSTINTLPKRLGGHKKHSKIYPERLVYKTIKDDWDRFYIELYELYPCGSKNELVRREGEITREIGTMNMKIAGRTIKEYRQDNRKEAIEYQVQYRQGNKEKILEQKQHYYLKNAEKITEKQRAYRLKNDEKITEKQRAYRLKNDEVIKEYQRQYRALKKQAQTQAN